ncbi:hypothetical protein Tco_1373504 [Tanacetum coccineum]
MFIYVGCLKNAGLPQNEDNVVSMFCFLKLDTKESISYGHVRNFMVLLPSNQLQEDPRWPCLCIVYIYNHSTDKFIDLKAGRSFNSFLVCLDSSASINYFLLRSDCKTYRSFMEYTKTPFLRLRTIFKSCITGIFEASKTVPINFAPTLPDLQVKVIP